MHGPVAEQLATRLLPEELVSFCVGLLVEQTRSKSHDAIIVARIGSRVVDEVVIFGDAATAAEVEHHGIVLTEPAAAGHGLVCSRFFIIWWSFFEEKGNEKGRDRHDRASHEEGHWPAIPENCGNCNHS